MIIGVIIVIIFVLYFYIPKFFRKKVEHNSDAIKFLSSRLLGSPQKIPYTIIQTHNHDKISESMKNAMMKIMKFNPEYEYKYFNDDDRKNYLKDNFGEYYVNLYDSLVPGAYKADLFRMCYLNKHGGVYIDSGFDEIFPLRDLIESNDEFIAPQDMGGNGIANGFICSIPNHELSSKNLDLMVYNISKKLYRLSSLHITGPGALGESYNSLYGQLRIGNKNNIKIISHERSGNIFNRRNIIKYNDKIIFNTRYQGYDDDRKETRYSDLWTAKKVYK